MKLENLNFIRIEQSKFEKELEEETNKYLYHFIVCKMTDGQIIKVDNYNNLDELKALIADYETKYKMTSLDKDTEFLNRNL